MYLNAGLSKSKKPLRGDVKSSGGHSISEMEAVLTQGQSRYSEILIEKILFIAGVSSIIVIALIFIFLFKEAILFFKTVPAGELIGKVVYDDWEEKNVFKMMWQAVSEVPKYSLIPLICGSFLVAIPATLISTFLGLGCAIYLSEIAPGKVREVMKPTLELLAGIPTVVLGFFVLTLVATHVQNLLGTKFRLNAFVGSLGVSLAILPLIITIAEDAMRAVPKELRDASEALGASKWQTILGTVLPAAISGISAAVILGFGRALGETMIVVMSTGNAALVTGNVFSSVRTMTANIAAEMGSVARDTEHYYSLFVVGAVLFSMTFILNVFAELILQRMRNRLRM